MPAAPSAQIPPVYHHLVGDIQVTALSDGTLERSLELLRSIQADEAQKLAAGMKELVNQSTEGLAEVHHADGSVSVDLDGRFQNVTVARVNPDGTISQSCVDNPRSAGAFFGIDPKLIDPNADTRNFKPAKAPARNNN